MTKEPYDEWRTPEETARLRDEAFARLMRLPPKPQKDMKLGRRRGRTSQCDPKGVMSVGDPAREQA
jgi:hypothetical protein